MAARSEDGSHVFWKGVAMYYVLGVYKKDDRWKVIEELKTIEEAIDVFNIYDVRNENGDDTPKTPKRFYSLIIVKEHVIIPTNKVKNIDEMLSLLSCIDSEFVAVAKDRMPLSKIADMVALDCWLRFKTEDMFTKELRRQINHANKHGVFDFD